jgi:hypothetical protein
MRHLEIGRPNSFVCVIRRCWQVTKLVAVFQQTLVDCSPHQSLPQTHCQSLIPPQTQSLSTLYQTSRQICLLQSQAVAGHKLLPVTSCCLSQAICYEAAFPHRAVRCWVVIAQSLSAYNALHCDDKCARVMKTHEVLSKAAAMTLLQLTCPVPQL